MPQLLDLVDQKEFVVLVSLPSNNIELAAAAYKAGADGIKVHLNVEHKASGTLFGSWAQEKDTIAAILSSVDCPVGIMPGSQITATVEELYDAARLGVDFLDIYDYDMPVWMMAARMSKMIAIGHDFQLADLQGLEKVGADLLEASIVPSSQYRQPLTVKDLEAYQAITAASELPVFVPTQKRIEPADLVVLRDLGVQGVILGTVSLGETADSFRERIPLYLNAIK